MKKILLTLIMTAFIMPVHAATKTVKLTKTPDVSEEGTYLYTTSGEMPIYSLYFDNKSIKTAIAARKGDCIKILNYGNDEKNQLRKVACPTDLNSGSKLPFIGKRQFNFMGGNATELSITIRKNGYTIITAYTINGEKIEYKGKYKNMIPDDSGLYYRFTTDSVDLVDKNGVIQTGCREEHLPCTSDVYKPW